MYNYSSRLFPVGKWNKESKLLSTYSELSVSFCIQKFTKTDKLVNKLSCNSWLHILFSVYIFKKNSEIFFNDEEFLRDF